MVKCPKGTIKNPETQNCVLIDGRVGKRILLERKLKRSASRKSPRRRSSKKCPKGTIKNPETQNCVLVDGRVGKRILLERKLRRSPSTKSPRGRSNKKCPTGTIFEKNTKDCVLIEGQAGKLILLERKLKELASRGTKKHPSDLIWNSETKKWVLIDGRVGKRLLLEKQFLHNSSSHINTSSSSFPSTHISTSSSDVQLIGSINSSNSSTVSSDDLLTPLSTVSLGAPRRVVRFERLPPSRHNPISHLPPPMHNPISRLPPAMHNPISHLPPIRSPEPRIQATVLPHKRDRYDRLPPDRRSPSPFTRSPSQTRLPPRIEPTVFLPSPTISKENKYTLFPSGPGIYRKIALNNIREDCEYIKQWKIGKETGSGEVGTTKIITHKKYHYDYVLKSQKKDAKFTSQFGAEIQALVSLQGTNLVPKIYDIWTCRTMGYIIMEQLYNCDDIDPQKLYKKIGEKLKLLREAGWLHVDTHDGNVMCTADGEPVIIDFGYAVRRKQGGDNATYSEHPKSQRRDGWGVPLPWKFLEVMQEVNFHESFNPYGSKDRRIRQLATKQNELDYKNMQKKYKEAQQKLAVENGYRGEEFLDERSDYDRKFGVVI